MNELHTVTGVAIAGADTLTNSILCILRAARKEESKKVSADISCCNVTFYRVPAGIIEHLRFEVHLAYKALSWQDRLCTRRFSQDSLAITVWIRLLQLCLPKVQRLKAEVGGGGKLLNGRGQC